jgi:hypothetical protein
VQPAAVVVWAQSPHTADPAVFARLPPARGGRLLVAAGPGWTAERVPPRVVVIDSLAAALALLVPDHGPSAPRARSRH